MTDRTNAERQRRWRERQRQGVAYRPMLCEICGAAHHGRHGRICWRCWERSTPAGRTAHAARVKRARERTARA